MSFRESLCVPCISALDSSGHGAPPKSSECISLHRPDRARNPIDQIAQLKSTRQLTLDGSPARRADRAAPAVALKPLDAAALDEDAEERIRACRREFFLGLCNWMARAQNYLDYMEQLC